MPRKTAEFSQWMVVFSKVFFDIPSSCLPKANCLEFSCVNLYLVDFEPLLFRSTVLLQDVNESVRI